MTGEVPRHVAIVGAAVAGTRTVRALRRAGYDGRITLVGEEEHPPYDRPPLSKELLAGSATVDQIRLDLPSPTPDRDERLLGSRAVRLLPRERTVVLADGREVLADAVVVATGATPRRLPHQPTLAGVHVLRTLDDALAIRAAAVERPAVAVIGGGFIGAEVAASLRRLGLAVTLLEALPAPLVRGVGPRVGAALAELHRDEGVDVRTSVTVEAVVGGTRVEQVRLADGSAVPAQLVVVGVGAAPATGWLEGSGLPLDDGLVCDPFCRVQGIHGVWAAGDVARFEHLGFGQRIRLEHWTNATQQAQAVAHNLLSPDALAPFTPLPYVWSDQYDTTVQIVGRVSADDDMKVVEGRLDERRFLAVYSRDGRLRGAVGMGCPAALHRTRPFVERADPVDALRSAAVP